MSLDVHSFTQRISADEKSGQWQRGSLSLDVNSFSGCISADEQSGQRQRVAPLLHEMRSCGSLHLTSLTQYIMCASTENGGQWQRVVAAANALEELKRLQLIWYNTLELGCNGFISVATENVSFNWGWGGYVCLSFHNLSELGHITCPHVTILYSGVSWEAWQGIEAATQKISEFLFPMPLMLAPYGRGWHWALQPGST
eukprot:12032542-Karenia_brevis.AAC.1